jgi:sugar phosphate permease
MDMLDSSQSRYVLVILQSYSPSFMSAKDSLNIAALPKQSVSLRLFWQSATVALLVTGYAGYYLCRSNMSATLPMIAAELASRGMDLGTARLRLGTIAGSACPSTP